MATPAAAAGGGQLPLHYRDPVDRQLVAQSIKRIATAGCPPLKENLRSC